MDLAAADRKWAALHGERPWHDGSFTSWTKERSDSHPFHFQDGVRLWVSDVDYSPDDLFLQFENAPLRGGAVDREEDGSGDE